MNLISYSKYKKRVVSTLFLYVVILLLGCDFKSPEEWENPAWYTDLTLPLVNKEFSFGGLLSDTTFYSDTLDVALPSDTVSEVIHLNYPVTMPPVQIPDDIFDIDMSEVEFTDPDFGDMGEDILLPSPDFDEDATLTVPIPDPESNCFPQSMIITNDISIPTFPDTDIPISSFPVGNDFLEIKKILFRTATWNIRVENSLPFPITVEEFSIKNGDALFTAEGLENIMPYSFKSDKATKEDELINFDEDLKFIFRATPNPDLTSATCPNNAGPGWDIEPGDSFIKVFFGCDFGPIDSVTIYTDGINESQPAQNKIQGNDDELQIFRAKMAESTVDYPNKVYLEFANDFFLPSDLTITFENFFKSICFSFCNSVVLWRNSYYFFSLKSSKLIFTCIDFI